MYSKWVVIQMVISISSVCLSTDELTNQIAQFQAEELYCWSNQAALVHETHTGTNLICNR